MSSFCLTVCLCGYISSFCFFLLGVLFLVFDVEVGNFVFDVCMYCSVYNGAVKS